MANSILSLSSLNGSNGFRIDGAAAGDRFGISVSNAGDINGDDIADLIVGAPYADPNGLTNSGASYVVFGKSSGFSPTLALADLNGSNGFRIDGVAAYDRSGWSVSSAGDINGDDIDDLIVGASFADPNNLTNSGASYVVFGNSAPVLDLGGAGTAGINYSTTFTGAPVALVDSAFTLEDNGTTLASITVTLTNRPDGSAELLTATTTGTPITASYSSSTGVLSLTGNATIGQYKQVLAGLSYSNSATAPTLGNRSITFVVDDGGAHSNTSALATTTLTVAPRPNRPPVAVDDAVSTDENTVLTGIAVFTIVRTWLI